MSENNGLQQPSSPSGSRSQAAALEAALLDQCQRWQRGERVLAEAYLEQHQGLCADPEAALDLIGNEMLLRQDNGERIELEDYLRRFPLWSNQIRDQFEVEQAIRQGILADPTRSPGDGANPGCLPARSGGSPALPEVPGYEVLGELGRGGMGVVYRARQSGLGRVVALKMIPPGKYAGPEELARFRREAEAVARFRHPNIVQIHEVGEQGGLPFFSLEFLEGGSLAEKLRGTPQPARKTAELVEMLARAMHQAHQLGIVHRDLKPANVLLAEDGTPKITDFGLAKRLEGGDGDTQSGAILYECLTGRPPFQGETAGDILVQVLSEDVVPPRRLQPKCPRDLETICLKCLNKDSGKRYPSALALAEDLGRYLAGRPIQARPAGPIRHLARWAGRHPGVAALLATLSVVLTGGLPSMTLLWWRADEARRQEAKSFRDALGTVDDYLTQVSENRLLHGMGLQPLRKDLLQLAQRYYERFVRERGDDPTVRLELGRAYRRLASITHDIGSKDQALELARQAVAVCEKLVESAPADVSAQRELAGSHHTLGLLCDAAQRTKDAVAAHKRALALRERLAKAWPDDPDVHQDLAKSQSDLGLHHHNKGQLPLAETFYRNALTTFEKLLTLAPEDPGFQRSMAMTTNNLGVVCLDTSRQAEAERLHARALTLRYRLAASHPENLVYQQDLAMSYQNLAILYSQTGRVPHCVKAFQEAVAIRNRLARGNPAVSHFRSDLAGSHRSLAGTYLDDNQLDKAQASYDQARDILSKLAKDHPTTPAFRRDLAMTIGDLGVLHQRGGRLPDAEKAYRESGAALRALADAHPDIAEYECYLGIVLWNLGNVSTRMNRLDKAAPAFQEAHVVQERLARQFPAVAMYRSQLAETCNSLGNIHKSSGRMEQAEKAYDQALAIRKILAADNPTVPDYQANVADCQVTLGVVYQKTNRAKLALAAYQAALSLHENLAQAHPRVSSYRSRMADTLNQLGLLHQQESPARPVEAEAAFRKALALREGLARAHPREWRFAVSAGGTWLELGALLRRTKRPDEALDCFARSILLLEPMVREDRNRGDGRTWLCSAHEGRALVREGKGQWKEAGIDWERALELDDGSKQAQLRLRQAVNLAHRGEHVRACAGADEVTRAEPLPGPTLYEWARVYTLAAAAAREDGKREPTERLVLAGRYAGRALDVLRQATRKGFRDAALIEQDPALDVLRSRDDFRKLVDELRKTAVR